MIIRKIVEELCLFNYFCYFFIYYIIGESFCKEVWKLCCWKFFKLEKDKNIVISKLEYIFVIIDNVNIIKLDKGRNFVVNRFEYIMIIKDNMNKYENSIVMWCV